MSDFEKIFEIYKNEENNFINEDSLETVKTVALYMFYHSFNADVTKLDELNSLFCFLTGEIADIIAINTNNDEENTIDFYTSLPASIMTNITKLDFADYFNAYLKRMNQIIADVICLNKDNKNERIIKKLMDFDLDDNTSFIIKILCNYSVSMKQKIWYQNIVDNYKVKNGSIRFQILFEDDILEEVDDIESPKDCVAKGDIQLYQDYDISFFGEERSFLGFISAKSLKENYFLYSTKGLFASNLRYYVRNVRIDSQITRTILDEPENFCYYNNGIIITCDNYKIEGNIVTLYNFSIVNGGQTTNLIGRTEFETDFAVMCKVIKNKYKTLDNKVQFLSQVAEASNTQKPIKAKDLIANRPEQRMLKIQFSKANIFLQVKRGEKIPKDIYSQPWQNATNDQVAQMLYSCVYQLPGSAKNVKSKLLENETIYSKIFKSEYSTEFLVSLQHIKVSFSNWVKILKKNEKNGSAKLGLAKNADLLTLGLIGLVYKILSNDKLLLSLGSYIENETEDNDLLKYLLGQNDIGELKLLNENLLLNLGKASFFNLYEYLYEKILIPSYLKFKQKHVGYSYGTFVKSDQYYYNFVVPDAIKHIMSNPNEFSFDTIYDFSKESKVFIDIDESFDEYKPGLEEELKEYRMRTYKSLNLKPGDIFRNSQMVSLIKYKPKNLDQLREICKFSSFQCENFGDAICKIIQKYSNVNDYLGGE